MKDLYIEGKQFVPHGVKTEVQGLPGCHVYQESGANAWVKSYEDGSLLLSPLAVGESWIVYPGSAGVSAEGQERSDP